MKKPSKEELAKDMLSAMSWKDIANKYGYTESSFLRKTAKEYGIPGRRKILKPSKDILEQYIKDGLNPYQIADLLGYGKGGWRNIYYYLEEYKIEFDFTPNNEIRSKEFNQTQKSLIYGTMLGDGYLRGKNSVCLTLSQSIKQLEYLEWKRSILGEFILANKPYMRENNNKSLNQTYLCTYNTIAHGWLKELKDKLYPNNIKTITKDYLDNIDEFALAVWFMDDGSLNKKTKSYTLCTQSFTLEEHELLQIWFEQRYGLKLSIYKAKYPSGIKYYSWFNVESSKKLSNIIKEYVPNCMAYKTIQN